MSPVDCPSIEYSSVVAEPAPTIDQPFVVLKGRSFICGVWPLPYPEPPEPICVVKPFVVPFEKGRFAVTHMLPGSVREEELST